MVTLNAAKLYEFDLDTLAPITEHMCPTKAEVFETRSRGAKCPRTAKSCPSLQHRRTGRGSFSYDRDGGSRGECRAGVRGCARRLREQLRRARRGGRGLRLLRRGHEGRRHLGWCAPTDTGRAYDDDTLQLVFSTTKGAAAASAHLLAHRGPLDVDAPVATYWPEFGQAGKDHIPVRWLLATRPGCPRSTPS